VLAFGVTLEMQREQPGIESSAPEVRSIAPAAPEPALKPAASARADRMQDEKLPAEKVKEEKPPVDTMRAKKLRAEEIQEEKRAAVLGKIQERKSSAPPEKQIAPAKPAQFATPQAAPATQSFATQQSGLGRVEPRPFEAAPAAPAAPPPADAVAPATSAARPPPPAAAPARAAPMGGAENQAASPSPAVADKAVAPMMKREAAGSAATRMLQSAPLPEADAGRELERIARLRAEGRHAEADKALEEFRRKYPDFRIPEAMWERVKPR